MWHSACHIARAHGYDVLLSAFHSVSPSAFTEMRWRTSPPDFTSSYASLTLCRPHRPPCCDSSSQCRAFAPFPRQLLAHPLASFTALFRLLLHSLMYSGNPCPWHLYFWFVFFVIIYHAFNTNLKKSGTI